MMNRRKCLISPASLQGRSYKATSESARSNCSRTNSEITASQNSYVSKQRCIRLELRIFKKMPNLLDRKNSTLRKNLSRNKTSYVEHVYLLKVTESWLAKKLPEHRQSFHASVVSSNKNFNATNISQYKGSVWKPSIKNNNRQQNIAASVW